MTLKVKTILYTHYEKYDWLSGFPSPLRHIQAALVILSGLRTGGGGLYNLPCMLFSYSTSHKWFSHEQPEAKQNTFVNS